MAFLMLHRKCRAKICHVEKPYRPYHSNARRVIIHEVCIPDFSSLRPDLAAKEGSAMNAILSATGLKFLDLIAYPPIEINPAKATFLTGESGSGKSTLLKLLNATAAPSAGVILYEGSDVEGLDTVKLRREVVLAAQGVFLFDGTIRQNFDQFHDFRDEPPIGEEEIKRCLALCCAEFPPETRCETLSGGERQRVFLAIHLSFKPKVLMLDEPTSALDEATAFRLLTNVKAWCAENGTTLVAISHDQKLVEAFADEVIRLVGRANA